MLVRLRVLLAASCVAAFFSLVFGHRPRLCSSNVWGNVTGVPSGMPYHSVMGPGIVRWKIVVPQICQFETVGTVITACDADSAPSSKFFNQSTIYIERSGNVWIPGSVDVKVFCQKTGQKSEEPNSEFDEYEEFGETS